MLCLSTISEPYDANQPGNVHESAYLSLRERYSPLLPNLKALVLPSIWLHSTILAKLLLTSLQALNITDCKEDRGPEISAFLRLLPALTPKLETLQLNQEDDPALPKISAAYPSLLNLTNLAALHIPVSKLPSHSETDITRRLLTLPRLSQLLLQACESYFVLTRQVGVHETHALQNIMITGFIHATTLSSFFNILSLITAAEILHFELTTEETWDAFQTLTGWQASVMRYALRFRDTLRYFHLHMKGPEILRNSGLQGHLIESLRQLRHLEKI